MKDKVAIITGASVGIGRAVALKMAEEGAKVVLLDLNLQTLEKTKKEIEDMNCQVLAYECDVSNEKRVIEVVLDVIDKFGSVDILVNNAGIWRNSQPFVETPNEKWKSFIDVNIMGVVYCTKAVLPSMIQKGYGRIVNVASVAGVYGNRNMAMYSATKGAVISMTKALAKEVIEQGIVVNSVSPGTVSDSSNLDVNHSTPTEVSYAGRTGTDMENAELICFLASEKVGYIVGQNIQIDGCRKRL
jgi:3-oxoacyl-[acyl-carrier protein] reductase